MELEEHRFNMNAKGWFLTYPKCTLDKEELLEHLKNKRAGLQQAVVSREEHSDGTPHLHVYLYFEERVSIKNARYWDVEGFHPNIQVAKSLKAVKDYIKKDGDILEFGIDYQEELSAIKDHRRALGKRLMDGEALVDVMKDAPELMFGFKKIYEDVEFYKKVKAPLQQKCIGFIPNTWGLILPVLESKHRHYWFWSDKPNKGKTTWLQNIKEKYPSMWYSWTEKYQNFVNDAQFILLDEYSTGHLTVTQLNMMCDGTYAYPVKGSSGFQLPKSIVLVCGNRDPLEIYDSKFHELIKARFIINCLDI